MKNSTTIYCCYHEPSQISNDNNILTWVYGQNDPLNKFISEFSAYRYIYENDINSEYIGICHYRRQLYENDIDYEWLTNDKCIAYTKMQHFPGRPHDAYSIRRWSKPTWFNCRSLYFDWIEYIRSINCLEYFEGDEFTAYQGLFIYRSICVMNRYHFMNLCQYVLGFLDFIDNKY